VVLCICSSDGDSAVGYDNNVLSGHNNNNNDDDDDDVDGLCGTPT